ncbi:MAG: hypothetical protein PHV74_12760 [Dehalococcoidia bacterium]|nr:hypothetical protein [Dehalococcoidia bacterium]
MKPIDTGVKESIEDAFWRLRRVGRDPSATEVLKHLQTFLAEEKAKGRTYEEFKLPSLRMCQLILKPLRTGLKELSPEEQRLEEAWTFSDAKERPLNNLRVVLAAWRICQIQGRPDVFTHRIARWVAVLAEVIESPAVCLGWARTYAQQELACAVHKEEMDTRTLDLMIQLDVWEYVTMILIGETDRLLSRFQVGDRVTSAFSPVGAACNLDSIHPLLTSLAALDAAMFMSNAHETEEKQADELLERFRNLDLSARGERVFWIWLKFIADRIRTESLSGLDRIRISVDLRQWVYDHDLSTPNEVFEHLILADNIQQEAEDLGLVPLEIFRKAGFQD